MSSNDGKKSLFNDIFIESKEDPNQFLPILKSSDSIPKIIPFLKDTKNPISDKIAFLSSLNSLFKDNKNLIHCFMDKCTLNRSNLFEP